MPTAPTVKRFVSIIAFVGLLLYAAPASALTVRDVAEDLACPCICPLILEDCNMTCGLDWKDQIGEQIKAGLGKQQIIDKFVAEHGESAILTPLQRLEGKLYQYTRGFGHLDWAVLWAGVAIWLGLLFAGFYFGVRKVLATAK